MISFHRALGLAGAIAITAACGSAAAPAPAATATPAPKPADVAIDIQAFKFPANTDVPKGTKITWTNKDTTKHTVTSGTRPAKDGRPPLDLALTVPVGLPLRIGREPRAAAGTRLPCTTTEKSTTTTTMP